MRLVLFALLLSLATSAVAQNSRTRFREAEKVWVAHRPDGMTWDDGTPEAAHALDQMWRSVTDAANEYLHAHAAATPKQLKNFLKALTPIADPRFGNGLEADVLKLEPTVFLISFTDGPASTVFTLNRNSASAETWRINDARPQAQDKDHLLEAWRSRNAYDKCLGDDPKGLFIQCGPLGSTIGLLSPDASGAPRFYIEAAYSKDAGASIAQQTSIWRWDGKQATTLWIDRYVIHLEATRPLRIQGSTLSYGEQDGFKAFSACMSCDSRQLLRRVSITPNGVKDLGMTVLYPELDRVDDLLWAIAKNHPTTNLASPTVVRSMRPRILKIKAASNGDDPNYFSVGMLEDWSILRRDEKSESICVKTDELGELDFTLATSGPDKDKLISVTPSHASSGSCPTAQALHKPYSTDE